MPPLKHSSKTPSQGKDYSDDNCRDLLEKLGISSQQFQTIFSHLTQGGIALCKMVYDEKGVPVDFILLEANPSFEEIFGVKREQIILKKATQFNPKMKESFVEYIGMYGKVAKTGLPEKCEVYFQPQDKFYQVYAYSPKKTILALLFR
jgi:PAS domain-containing protein